MYVQRDRYLALDAPLAWWPRTPDDALALLDRWPVVNVMQCSAEVRDALAPYAFRVRPFHTILIDLTRDEDAILAGFDKNCRRYIRKGQQIHYDIRCNDAPDDAFALLNDFIARSQYRPPMEHDEWARATEHADVFTVHVDGRVIACHVTICDAPHRAHIVLGAMIDRHDPDHGHLTGPLNRTIYWHKMQHYKAQGIRTLDLGGIDPDPESDLYSITRFKRSFGGTEVCEYFLRLARSPLVRLPLRLAHDTRARFRQAA